MEFATPLFPPYTIECIICNKNFIANKSNAKTCSSECRSKLSRANKKVKEKKLGGIVENVISSPAKVIELIETDKRFQTLIDTAMPEHEWHEQIKKQVKNLIDAQSKYGKQSYQYKSAFKDIEEFNVPRIKTDGTIWNGITRLK